MPSDSQNRGLLRLLDGVQMIFQRLTALFARYSSVHLVASASPMPLLGERDQILGNIDRVSFVGRNLTIEGWVDADQITLSQTGQIFPHFVSLPRPDVVAAYPDLQTATPGFAVTLPFGADPASLTVAKGINRFVYRLPCPSQNSIRMARVRLILPFLRALAMASPTILHWLITKDPAHRARLKHYFRLEGASNSQAMQPLLFLKDSLAHMPEKQRAPELARLLGPALAHRAITIVMPIYNAFDLLPEVLDRVVRHTDLPWRLILIDDASPDPAVRPFLRNWVHAQRSAFPDRITLLEHTENHGFIKSVNAGLKLALGHGDHVVLLNSDAFVPNKWASRLMRPFLAHDHVASVTPMSNDAEIFTVPVICKRNSLQTGVADAIDAIAAEIHPDAGLADAPTGVGFCMAMSIDYLRRLPTLDTVFGRGYGEEVDWCQRARALGGRHLGLANLFVEHRGGSSFGQPEKQRLVAANGSIISRRYPSFDADVQKFLTQDPLVASRLAMAIAWACTQSNSAVPLYIAHNLGGGAEDYLAQRIAKDMPNPALVLRVGTSFRWQLEVHSAHGITKGSCDDLALIQRLLNPAARLHIIYSCGVGAANPANLPTNILSLKRGPQDRIGLLIHDYFPISPSYTLLNSDGYFDGLPDPATRDLAHHHRNQGGTLLPLNDWQAEWAKLVDLADEITAFSPSSATIFGSAYPSARKKLRIVPHQPLAALPQVKRPTQTDGPVIGVLGNIGHPKGASVLQSLSRKMLKSGTAKIVVLGKVDPAYPLGNTVKVHGGYQHSDIAALITRYGITDWLIPSVWPETFSYTTHEAIATGLPVFAFDLGAQGDAIRAAPLGHVIPIPGGLPDVDALFAALTTSTPKIESNAA